MAYGTYRSLTFTTIFWELDATYTISVGCYTVACCFVWSADELIRGPRRDAVKPGPPVGIFGARTEVEQLLHKR